LKVTTEWQKKVQQLTQHNEIFQEQTASLEVRVAELEAQLREVRVELSRATAAAQQSEARGDGLQAALLQADTNQSRFLNFQRNVLVMYVYLYAFVSITCY
jgi:phage shock protein A